MSRRKTARDCTQVTLNAMGVRTAKANVRPFQNRVIPIHSDPLITSAIVKSVANFLLYQKAVPLLALT